MLILDNLVETDVTEFFDVSLGNMDLDSLTCDVLLMQAVVRAGLLAPSQMGREQVDVLLILILAWVMYNMRCPHRIFCRHVLPSW